MPLSKLLNLDARCTAPRPSASILLYLYKSLSQRGFDVCVSKTIAGLSEYIDLRRILTRPRAAALRQVHLRPYRHHLTRQARMKGMLMPGTFENL